MGIHTLPLRIFAIASALTLAPPGARADSAEVSMTAIPPAPSDDVPAPPVSAPPVALLDAVRLVDGGLYLGTILAFVPGEYVLLRSYAGAEHCIAWRDVAYAGPAAHELSVRLSTPTASRGLVARLASFRTATRTAMPTRCTSRAVAAPSATDPVPSRHDPSLARVDLDAGDHGYTIHLHTGMSVTWTRRGPGRRVPKFTRVCTTPCVAFLEPGRQPLAVSTGARKPVIVRGGVDIRDGSHLVVTYESRRATRIAGALTVAVGVLAGFGMILGAEISGGDCSGTCNGTQKGLYASGGVLAGVGLAVGIPLVTRRDRARIRARPASTR